MPPGKKAPRTGAKRAARAIVKKAVPKPPGKRARASAESPAALARRGQEIVAKLERAYPDWGPTLDFTNPFELLVATILAAQSTDEGVNKVTRALFEKYRGPEDYLAAPAGELERDIYATGYYRQKAKAIRAVSEGILERFSGEVPRTMEELTSLFGVGRKTASVVLGTAFEIPAVAVDTHVDRVSRRLALAPAEEEDREKIEAALKEVFPEKDWTRLTWLLILHGRRCCAARRPDCPRCPVRALCPYPEKTAGDAPER